MAKNRFAALLEEKGLPAGEVTEEAPPTRLPGPAPVRVLVESPAPPPPPAPPAAAALKTGKRSDPSYRQISTYVRSDLYKQVRKRLTDEERDFAELLDELLEKWIGTPQDA